MYDCVPDFLLADMIVFYIYFLVHMISLRVPDFRLRSVFMFFCADFQDIVIFMVFFLHISDTENAMDVINI